MSADETAAARAMREAVVWVPREDRGLVVVTGSDRVRWLNGMVTNDVASLGGESERVACYALLLTSKGRIVADLHVIAKPEALWLETARSIVPRLMTDLDKFIIADDVHLEDRSGAFARFSLEGPAARALIGAIAGREIALVADDATEIELAGVECTALASGWSGAPALLFLVPAAGAEAVDARLREAGEAQGLVVGDLAALELARVEAGTPRLDSELDESVLPAEAGLERAVSITKGCYTGQEIVARLRTQGRVSHHLVGLRFDRLPEPGAPLEAEGRRAGEVTSVVESPRFGTIGLGFVRRGHEEPGTTLESAGTSVRVEALPFRS